MHDLQPCRVGLRQLVVEHQLLGLLDGEGHHRVGDVTVLAIGFGFAGGDGDSDPYCGDGECNGDEDYWTCPDDCDYYGCSDRTLKEDIEFMGISPSGIKIYEFGYIDAPGRYRGVMAQDLLDTEYRDAVSKNSDGYYIVDYSKIDVELKRID